MLQKHRLDRWFCFLFSSCLSHQMACWILRAFLSRAGLWHESQPLYLSCTYFTPRSINDLWIFPCNIHVTVFFWSTCLLFKPHSNPFVLPYRYYTIWESWSLLKYAREHVTHFYNERQNILQWHGSVPSFCGGQVQSSPMNLQKETWSLWCTFFLGQIRKVCAVDTFVVDYLLHNLIEIWSEE